MGNTITINHTEQFPSFSSTMRTAVPNTTSSSLGRKKKLKYKIKTNDSDRHSGYFKSGFMVPTESSTHHRIKPTSYEIEDPLLN
jgi:hypothetical protein